ncbi:MAG: segregation/condensation protein A, partial [Candidatus Dadabacteria bacterium]|nr:segregation/condensation protein A [Candidatus Dadabacteria bacterium]
MEDPQSVYSVQLEIFNGPLDLLLHLIKKHEVDIYDIPIALITEQYLEYLEFLKDVNLEIVGDYMSMAAELGYIKSRMLLPRIKEEGEEEEEDPREELVRRLLEYEKNRSAAAELGGMEILGKDIFLAGYD